MKLLSPQGPAKLVVQLAGAADDCADGVSALHVAVEQPSLQGGVAGELLQRVGFRRGLAFAASPSRIAR
jgi:hypothetical protein